jgi:hypothetical protein
MNMAALIKTEPGTCKPEANKSIAAKAPSSKNKISLLPYAVNGANSSTNIKKRATLQAGRNFPPSKSKPKCAPMNPKKKPRLSAPPFLQYILDPEHPWEVCLGLPNGTHVWQVGDSVQQNGSYKPGLVIAKRELVREKQDAGEEGKLTKSDIVPLVNKAFPRSFGKEEGNRHAIAERGWNPLNRGCLTNPEIIATKVARNTQAAATTTGTKDHSTRDEDSLEDSLSDQIPDSQETTSSEYLASKVDQGTLDNLNFTAGHAGSILNRINQQSARREGQVKSYQEVEEKRKKRAENGERVTLMNKRATSGLFVQEGLYSVNQAAPYLQEKAEDKEKAAQAVTLEKKIKEYRSNIIAYNKGLKLRDTLAESDWKSVDYKSRDGYRLVAQDYCRHFCEMVRICQF